jgi:hypothetical protein
MTPDIHDHDTEELIQLVIEELSAVPPAEQPPAEQPPAEQPPAEQPPAEQPPAEQPPAEPMFLPIDNDEIQLQIPKIIYICHKNISCLSMTHNKWKKLNPNYDFFLFDDSMCEQFLLKEYSQLHYNIFKFIRDGPIKSDFWRLCILYKYGGIYVDADIQPLIPLDTYLIPTSDFVTCITNTNRNFNPHFIAVKKKEHILELCINEYIGMYTYKRHSYDYWKWSIVHIFNKYLNNLRNPKINTIVFKNKKFQFFIEKTNSHLRSPSLHDYYCVFNNVRLFNSRYINYHPFEHQFKDSICVSHNNGNSKYNMICFEMKNTLINSNKVNIGLVRGTGRNMMSTSMSDRNINSTSVSDRNIKSTSVSGRRIMSNRRISSRSRSSKNRIIAKKSFSILFNG